MKIERYVVHCEPCQHTIYCGHIGSSSYVLSDQDGIKLACAATETIQMLENSDARKFRYTN